jgi:hypothetical protein
MAIASCVELARMAAFIDRAGSSRTKCAYCGSAIARTEIRVVHELERPNQPGVTRTYGHLPCTIELQRPLAHEALISRDTRDTIVSEVIADVSRRDTKLADEVRTHRARIPITREAKPLVDPRTLELLAELEVAPGDRGLLAVLGDHLQQLGDERGELIVLDLAASAEPDALVRRRELSARLSPKFSAARLSWGIGFLRRVELTSTPSSLVELAEPFAHPSCRLLESLLIGTGHRLPIEVDGALLPRSLRTLNVSGILRSDLTPLRHLATLSIGDAASLAHPTVRSLELASPTRDTIRALDPGQLPAVTKLSVSRYSEANLIPDLEAAGWFARITELSLDLVAFAPADDHAILVRSFERRKLARLSLHPQRGTPLDLATLQSLTDVLDAPANARPPADLVHVEHTGKPEWGRGRIVREFDGKLEIAFPSGGTRTLKADAPFLKRSRE